eukprot:364007-Chlamydomonas_euryale.AAC.4
MQGGRARRCKQQRDRDLVEIKASCRGRAGQRPPHHHHLATGYLSVEPGRSHPPTEGPKLVCDCVEFARVGRRAPKAHACKRAPTIGCQTVLPRRPPPLPSVRASLLPPYPPPPTCARPARGARSRLARSLTTAAAGLSGTAGFATPCARSSRAPTARGRRAWRAPFAAPPTSTARNRRPRTTGEAPERRGGGRGMGRAGGCDQRRTTELNV